MEETEFFELYRPEAIWMRYFSNAMARTEVTNPNRIQWAVQEADHMLEAHLERWGD